MVGQVRLFANSALSWASSVHQAVLNLSSYSLVLSPPSLTAPQLAYLLRFALPVPAILATQNSINSPTCSLRLALTFLSWPLPSPRPRLIAESPYAARLHKFL